MGREIVSSTDSLKLELKELHAKREAVFEEILEHEAALPSDVGMDAPLVDREGFPRADIDVTAIRGHRQKICFGLLPLQKMQVVQPLTCQCVNY